MRRLRRCAQRRPGWLWAQGHYVLLLAVSVSGFFVLGIFAWLPIWLPALFPTRMRATVAFCFNAPSFISGIGPLIAGTLTVGLGGSGPAATIVGLFYLVGLAAVPFLPESKGVPLPETISLALPLEPSQPALTSSWWRAQAQSQSCRLRSCGGRPRRPSSPTGSGQESRSLRVGGTSCSTIGP